MLAVGDVRRWAPGQVDTVVTDLLAAENTLIGLDDEIADARTPPSWVGEAATGATEEHERLAERLRRMVAGVAAARRAAQETATATVAVLRALGDADELATGNGFVIGDDSVVRDVTPDQADPTGDRTRVYHRLVDAVEQLLRTGADVQSDLATILDRVAADGVDDGAGTSLAGAATTGAGHGDLTPPDPPSNGTPGDVRGWWESLSEADQAALLRDQPALVGGLDGVPVADRDIANRQVLAAERERVGDRIAELEADSQRSDDERRELDRLRDQRTGMDAIANRLTPGGAGIQQAYLIDLDTAGRGQAVVSIGNPDRADNIATMVPGTGTELGTIGGELGNADRLALQALRTDPTASTAVVTWIGYESPQWPLGPTKESFADAGGPRLDRFQDGLRATHDGPASHNTVIGHSYGTTVIGHGARDHDLDVDDMVLLGSPGVGVDTAGQLNHPADRVWASTAEHDIISSGIRPGSNFPNLLDPDLWHGNDPTDDDFGGRVFASDPGQWHSQVQAHLDYYRDDSSSLINTANVVTGAGDRVTR